MFTQTMQKFRTRGRSIRQRRPFGRMEGLESREMLAVEIVRTTDNQRFTVDATSIDKSYVEYQAFKVTNTSGGPLTDLWVRATNFSPTQKVQLAPNEDGLYYIGDLADGASDTAFFYLQATAVSTTTPDPQTYTIEVWDHGPPIPDPAIPGDAPLDAENFSFSWVAAADENNDGSVTDTVSVSYSFGGAPATQPLVGGEMTIRVTGIIKNNADRVLFMPSTQLTWPADAFELRMTNVSIDGVPLGEDIIWKRFGDRQRRDFIAEYTFAITDTTAAPTPVTPRQYTAEGAIGNRKFDHSRLLGGVIPIPPAVNRTALTITKTGATVAMAGSSATYSYTITVTSTGVETAEGVVVTDAWPAEFTRLPITPPSGTEITAESSTGFTWDVHDLPSGTSKSLVVSFTVPKATPSATYTNTATVTSTTPNPNPNTASIDTTVVDLLITKAADVSAVVAGGSTVHSFSITVQNTSPTLDLTTIVVDDTWPTPFVIVGFSGPGTTEAVGTNFRWRLSTLAKNSSSTLTVSYTVPKATPATTYTNTATVTSDQGTPSPNTASAAVAVFDLLITKGADPTIVPAGSSTPRSFTITVQNTSPTVDLTDVVVNDTWPVPFVITGFTGEGTTEIIGTNFRWTLPTLARNASKSLTVAYTVPKTTPLTTYTNTATVTSDQGTPVPNTASTTVTVVGVDLTITKVGDAATVKAGTTGHWYDITVTNTSTLFDAENVQVVDAWPAGFTQVAFSEPVTPLDPPGSGNFRWDIGTLPKGPLGTRTLRVTFDVPIGAALKLYSNFATVSSDTQDPGVKTAEADTLVVAAGVRAGVVICTDDGCSPAWVRVLDADGNLQSPQSQFQPYGNIRGGLRVTAADVNGDGVEEVIVAPGLGIRGPVRVLTTTGAPVPGFPDFYPYGPAWRNGVELAAADINNDGREDVITGMSLGVGTVNVYLVNGGLSLFRSFRGAPAGYAGGVRIGAADFGTYENGVLVDTSLDGKAEVVVGTNAGITAQVRIFDVQPTTPALARTILPFGTAFTGGVSISTGNYDNDPAQIPDILVGAGIGGRSVVKVFNAQTGTVVPGGTLNVFSTFAKSNAVVNVAPVDFDFDGTIDRLYGVQGRGGAGGTTGIKRVLLPSLSSTQLTSYAAPMRIAPITLAASMLSRATRGRGR